MGLSMCCTARGGTSGCLTAEKRENLSVFKYVLNLAKEFLHTSYNMFLNLCPVLIRNLE